MILVLNTIRGAVYDANNKLNASSFGKAFLSYAVKIRAFTS